MTKPDNAPPACAINHSLGDNVLTLATELSVPDASTQNEMTTWCPSSFINARSNNRPAFSLLILNIPLVHQALSLLLATASFIICADGGANRLREAQLQSSHADAPSWLPHVILGDLDSLCPDVRSYYLSQRVKIIHKADQDSTDFTKCLDYLRAREQTRVASTYLFNPSQQHNIVVLGSLSGRLDQAFATLQPLLKAQYQSAGLICNEQMILMAPEGVAFVLKPGRNRIHTPLVGKGLAKYVGIIPLGTTARITTEGLEWDVHDWETCMGGEVSTSNHIVADVVNVHVSLPSTTKGGVLFTVALAGS